MDYRKELERMDKSHDDYKVDKVITTAALALLAKLDEIQSTLDDIESNVSSINIRELLKED